MFVIHNACCHDNVYACCHENDKHSYTTPVLPVSTRAPEVLMPRCDITYQ